MLDVAQDILRFALLGCGAGAVYGLAALGIVLVYRGSGVVNFAAGPIGMVGAFIFYDQREAGASPVVAWGLALVFALLAGAVMQLVIMRSLRHAPPLNRLIATLAVFALLYSWADNRYGQVPHIIAPLLSTNGVELTSGIVIGVDRLILLGVGLGLTVALTVMS